MLTPDPKLNCVTPNTVEGNGYDPGRLRAVQDWYVRPQLAAVPGVAEVASVGGLPLEYQVELDPHRLRAHGIAPGQVAEAVRRANDSVGGNVVHKGNAEFVTRGVGWLGARPGEADAGFEPQRVIRDLENVSLTAADGTPVTLAEVAKVSLGSTPRRGVLEKDGTDATGGVVLMRHGENPLDVTRRLRAKIQELQPGLPSGVRVVAVYDRTPLIRGTIGTVTGTLLEAILTATVCILVVLRHVRTAFVVALTLPLAVLFSFGLTDLLRTTGLLSVETNLMSLAGLAISIGVLVDSSIVMAENVMHRLKKRYGDQVVRGDTRAEVLAACREIGRPIFFSVLIMLLSFLPVFALGGLEGKMFHPLAFTKSFAMLGVGLLSITLVPALCTVFVRGRLRSEEEVGLVRGLIRVYRPVLAFLLDRPAGIVWFVGLTFVLGAAPLGDDWLRVAVAAAVAASVWAASRFGTKVAAAVSLVLVGLVAGQLMTPLPREFHTPLDEGMVMDMPITVPRMSATQAADDLLARDMVFCRFSEVNMVVGKAGRAETAADPAPLDMIETMIDFRPREFWPRRCLRPEDSERQATAVLDALIARGLVRDPDARQAVATRVRLPDGVFVEWTGQFEHQERAGRTLAVAVPVVVGLIFLILWWTYRDLADAGLMLLAVPGALAGGVVLQWLLGYPLSVASWVGYIACFGMATSTGIIMLVYLRQAVADAGGLEKLTPDRLREVVLDGAAHRLRPKLLTEVTTLCGLAPLLLATGPGAEVLRPMVVPVLGGLLIADEVIDLFLPVLFYRIRLSRLRN